MTLLGQLKCRKARAKRIPGQMAKRGQELRGGGICPDSQPSEGVELGSIDQPTQRKWVGSAHDSGCTSARLEW